MQALWLHFVQWLHRMGLHIDADTAHSVAQGAAQAAQAAAQWDMPTLLALAGALGWASGLRLYAVVFCLGSMGALGWLALPQGLQVLQHPLVLWASGFMLCVEFLADKVPLLDSLWDGVHAFIRIPGGALLAAGVFGADDATLALAAGLLGGSLSATALATKMTARAAVQTSPEPFSNWGLSLLEDGLSLGALWLALAHPLWFAVALAGVLALSALLLVVLFRFLHALLRRVSSLFSPSGAPHV